MMNLHVVAFDVPYPPYYGGRIDVFYRIRALAQKGVHIHLHCFMYGDSQPADALRQYCKAIYYYPRKAALQSLPLKLPHIVASRENEELLHRLIVEDYPILFEGLHTCMYLSHPALQARRKLVRMHNIEWEYYRQLAERETDFVRKQYYKIESRRLLEFERVLFHADYILAIAPRDGKYLGTRFPNVFYLPASHPNTFVDSRTGSGHYALYHGKLSVAENHEAAMWLIHEVFAHLDVPLVIAGANPKPELITAISRYGHISLRHNVPEKDMYQLMQEAHIHVLPTFQPTGIKLKLLNALFVGRHVLGNSQMLTDTGVESLCHLADSPQLFRENVRRLYNLPFEQNEIARRIQTLSATFSNERNAEELLSVLR
jgi:glycosyltransferase involved in cell wall biosynthesis